MAILKKRSTAIAILVVVILAGTLFGAHRSLSWARSSVTKTFSDSDGSGYGIASNLNLRVQYARNLCKVAAKYDVADQVTNVRSACDALENSKGYADKFGANTILTESVDALNTALQACDLSDADKKTCAGVFADIDNYQRKTNRLAKDFNSRARDFNDEIEKAFPASLLSKLFGISEVEEYA